MEKSWLLLPSHNTLQEICRLQFCCCGQYTIDIIFLLFEKPFNLELYRVSSLFFFSLSLCAFNSYDFARLVFYINLCYHVVVSFFRCLFYYCFRLSLCLFVLFDSYEIEMHVCELGLRALESCSIFIDSHWSSSIFFCFCLFISSILPMLLLGCYFWFKEFMSGGNWQCKEIMSQSEINKQLKRAKGERRKQNQKKTWNWSTELRRAVYTCAVYSIQKKLTLFSTTK